MNRKKHQRRSVVLAALAGLLMLPIACKQDNELTSSLAGYEGLRRLAKFMTYNLTPNSRVTGVYKLSLQGTQAFDENYWIWEQPGYFLENDGRTLSTFQTLDSPEPQKSAEFSRYVPFADGTFATSRAYTGIIRPLPITGITRTLYDASGDQTTDTAEVVYKFDENPPPGELIQYQIRTKDASGDPVTNNTYTFKTDPRPYSEYYVSRYHKLAGPNSTLVGSVAIAITTDPTADNPSETITYERHDETGSLGAFDASGDLGHLEANFFDDANGAAIVKIIAVSTYYPDASGDISADSLVAITTKYSDAETAVFRETTLTHFDHYALRRPGYIRDTSHHITDGSLTLTAKRERWYQSGFLISDIVNSVTSSVATPVTHHVYTRDAQGRITAYERQDGSRNPIYTETYIFDDRGRTESIRSESVDPVSRIRTCSSAKNRDYEYETDVSGDGSTIRLVHQINYLCDGDTLDPNPDSKSVRTYNTAGQLVRLQQFSYLADYPLRTSLREYVYGINGELTQDIRYTVDSAGFATRSTSVVYTYDDNLFRISTRSLDADGNLSAGYYQYTYTYR